MKFSEMPYSRPDADGIKKQIAAFTERLKAAKTYEEAKAVFLENEEQAIARVAQRVSNGGHDIPEADIRRRFKRGIYNLLNLYMPICDSVLVYNNMKTPAQLVARKKSQADNIDVIESKMWNQLIQKI